MTSVINLRQARKERKRRDKDDSAQRNRVAHGRTKAGKEAVEKGLGIESRRLEGHRLDGRAGNDPASNDRNTNSDEPASGA